MVYKGFLAKLNEGERLLTSGEHLLKIKDIFDDQKILLRILENVEKAVRILITISLQIDYLHKRVDLSKDKKKNVKIFFDKSGRRYLNNNDLKVINEVLFLAEKHKQSGFEFGKGGKAIIMDGEKIYEIDSGKIREFLSVGRVFLENIRERD